MPVGRAGSSPPPVITPKPSTGSSTPASTGSSVTSAITSALSSDSFTQGLGGAIGNAVANNFGGGSSGRPDWAQAPREPHGEGMFKNKSETDIFRGMSVDDLTKASPREIYAMSAYQVSAFEKVLSGGPAVYDKVKGEGENAKLTPAQEKALGEETNKHYQENMAKLSPDQQRAFTFAKLHQGIFKDLMSTMSAHMKIGG